MQAIYYEQFQGPISVEQVPDPSPVPDGVVVAVKASGLCLSDWHGWMGHDPDIILPHVPGHEFAGEIAAVGRNVQSFRVGDRVTVPFVSGCGHCGQCRSGNQQVCDQQFQPGFTAWGSFAEFVALDYAEHNLVRLPEAMDFATAASLGCRFATAYRAVVDQGRVKGGEWVAVHGCGGVGLSALMIARAMGAQVIAVDIKAAALERARALGATATVLVETGLDVVDAVRALSGGGVHLSLDALGHPATLFHSVANLRKRGRHVQVGILSPEQAQAPIPVAQVIARELELYGSHGMQAYRYADMIELIKSGSLQPGQLVQAQVSLAETARLLPYLDQQSDVGISVWVP